MGKLAQNEDGNGLLVAAASCCAGSHVARDSIASIATIWDVFLTLTLLTQLSFESDVKQFGIESLAQTANTNSYSIPELVEEFFRENLF